MILIIDLSSSKIKLVLRKDNKEIANHHWVGLFQLSETLVNQISKFLKKNKIKLEDVKEVKVIPSKKSIVSTRIAKAVALGLKVQA